MRPANPSNNRLFALKSYERRLAEQDARTGTRSEKNLAIMMLLTKRLHLKPKPGRAVVYVWSRTDASIGYTKVAPLELPARVLGETSGYW